MKAKKEAPKKELIAKDELQKLGRRIKQLRVANGYTNYEHFAYEHGINRAQFGKYENGQNLEFASLIKILNALDISVKEFFSEGFE